MLNNIIKIRNRPSVLMVYLFFLRLIMFVKMRKSYITRKATLKVHIALFAGINQFLSNISTIMVMEWQEWLEDEQKSNNVN